jgi:hypothetical protein
MTYASGEKYQGQWVEDRKDGAGTHSWRQGQYLYTGQWKNGMVGPSSKVPSPYALNGIHHASRSRVLCLCHLQRWGKASFRFGNGVWYFEGEWKEDAPCLEGMLRGPNLSYVGEVMSVITSARGK